MLVKTQLQIFLALLILGFFTYTLLFTSNMLNLKFDFSSPFHLFKSFNETLIFVDKEKLPPKKTIHFYSECECKKQEQIVLHEFKTHFTVNLRNRKLNTTKFLYKITREEFKNLTLTCGMYNSLRRGKAQRVIAFSLYGNNTFFYDKLKVIAKQVDEIYAGWKMRIYHDNSIKKSIICEIECAHEQTKNKSRLLDNADFCNIENETRLKPIDLGLLNKTFTNISYVHAMKWRWLPIGDSFVEAFSSRDTDSYLLQREVDSVNVWTKSLDKLGHIMRGNKCYLFSYLLYLFNYVY